MRTVLLAAAVFLTLATAAHAQSTGTQASAGSQAVAIINTGGTGAGGSGSGTNGSAGDPSGDPGQNIYYHGIPRQAPTVYAPSIVGANPCVVGTSGGVSTPVVGLSLGVGTTDTVCQLHMIGLDRVAFELLCQQKDVRQAALAARIPCAADRAAGTAAALDASAPVSAAAAPAVAPVRAPVQLASAEPLTAWTIKPGAPKFCNNWRPDTSAGRKSWAQQCQ
jgi:hypothetical protein